MTMNAAISDYIESIFDRYMEAEAEKPFADIRVSYLTISGEYESSTITISHSILTEEGQKELEEKFSSIANTLGTSEDRILSVWLLWSAPNETALNYLRAYCEGQSV